MGFKDIITKASTARKPIRTFGGLICSLRPDEVFVFGSNIQGRHVGGAARTAYNNK
jgi:hypothetical protein